MMMGWGVMQTDTASVLHEAMGYIRFLQDQVQVLCSPYLQRLPSSAHLLVSKLLCTTLAVNLPVATLLLGPSLHQISPVLQVRLRLMLPVLPDIENDKYTTIPNLWFFSFYIFIYLFKFIGGRFFFKYLYTQQIKEGKRFLVKLGLRVNNGGCCFKLESKWSPLPVKES